MAWSITERQAFGRNDYSDGSSSKNSRDAPGQCSTHLHAEIKAMECSRLGHHSDRSDANNGALNAARVASTEAMSPAATTARSNPPREPKESFQPRDAIAGKMASPAQTTPVAIPRNKRKTFSARTIVPTCRGV